MTVGRTPTQETHNNILYFVDPQGRLRSSALPFANENRQGLYVLLPGRHRAVRPGDRPDGR